MRLLVDTNRFADLAANDRKSHERLQEAEEVWLSVVTIGELLGGFSRGKRRKQNEERLSQLLHLQGVGVLTIDQITSRYYANIWHVLRDGGKRIPTNDIWIAAQALQHDLTFDTSDAHFLHIPGLKLVSDQS